MLGKNSSYDIIIQYTTVAYFALLTDEKVIILMCDNSYCSLKSKDDEAAVMQAIERIINKKGKGFLAYLKNGKLSVDPDVLVQCLMSISPAPAPGFQERNRGTPFERVARFAGQSPNEMFRTWLRVWKHLLKYEPGDL